MDIQFPPTWYNFGQSAMSSITSPITLITAILTIGWLAWKFWENVSPAKSLPGIPTVEFDENNTRQRYATEAGSLLGKGYETVRLQLSNLCSSSCTQKLIALAAHKT